MTLAVKNKVGVRMYFEYKLYHLKYVNYCEDRNLLLQNCFRRVAGREIISNLVFKLARSSYFLSTFFA